MNMFRKILCTALAVALIAAMMLTAMAETATLYMRGKDNGTNFYESVELQNVTKDTRITDIKSSNKKVMKVLSLRKTTSTNKVYGTGKTEKSYGARISVNLMKLGTATLTYKQDGKRMSQKYVVKAYSNPISSLVLTGISDKDLKARFDKHGLADSLSLTKNASAGKLKVKAASGWVITSVTWRDQAEDSERCYYSYRGASSCTLSTPAMVKGNGYYLSVDLRNKATGGSQYVSISIE
ncbi:MAG: hypothetical protein IKQ80_14125 [Clostridia bacterium]|nr:hypothetical protein [Clostridia bacterium]